MPPGMYFLNWVSIFFFKYLPSGWPNTIIQTERWEVETKEDKRSRAREGRTEGNKKNNQANNKTNRKCITSKKKIPIAQVGAAMEAKNDQTDGEIMIGF